MNYAIKSAFAVPRAAACRVRSVSFFHSTPALERKRRTHWNGGGSHNWKKFNSYVKRRNRVESKRSLLRDLSDYAEELFQSWRDEDNRDGFFLHDDTAWFRRQYWSKGAKVNGFSSDGFQQRRCDNRRKAHFNFCTSDEEEEEEDDDGVESVFRSAFGEEQYYYWSFNRSGNFRQKNSSRQANYRRSSNWRYETDEESDSSSESDLSSERLALGLNASGPLKLEEVKHAYRSCALRWHPDRHQGSSKRAAEEKFKHCSAAYKSLCERLATQ